LIERVSENIVLVGTAHVSKKSVDEVRAAIEAYAPQIVGVELDAGRYEALRDRAGWGKTPVTEIVRSGRAYFFMAHLFLASFQRRLAEKLGVEPGAELIEAVNLAHDRKVRLSLLDRDIGVTLKRAWRLMTLKEKLRFALEAWSMLFGLRRLSDQAKDEAEAEARRKGRPSTVETQEDVEKLLDEDVLTSMMEEIGKFAPSVKRVLIDERDEYLAKRILLASREGRIVAVVGAGHMAGLKAALSRGLDQLPSFESLNAVPPRRVPWGTLFAWSVPLLLFWIVAYQALQGNLSRAGEALALWWIIHGALAGLGAALARGHPYSIATAAGVAGFTAIHPTLAAGWFAGLMEARVRTPTVADFERLQAWDTFRELFRNPVWRVLFVTALTNVGSSLATFVSLPILAGSLS
jgi:pheromone shutdown protein TraB